MKVRYTSGIEVEITGNDQQNLMQKFRQSGVAHVFLREMNRIIVFGNSPIAEIDLEDHKAKTVADFVTIEQIPSMRFSTDQEFIRKHVPWSESESAVLYVFTDSFFIFRINLKIVFHQY